MNYIVWNIRGVLGEGKKGFIRNLITEHNLKLVVLLEPMVASSKAHKYATSLGFQGAIIGTEGISKIWILWNTNSAPDIISIHPQCITLKMKIQNDEIYFSGIYAICKRPNRRELWSHLDSIQQFTKGTWVLGGDFNIYTKLDEKMAVDNMIWGQY